VADELREAFAVKAELVPGANGIFNVIVDGKHVFSNSETGRFPEPGEVTNKIKQQA
jgi:selT/selW/selH-like putative selenoprotein